MSIGQESFINQKYNWNSSVQKDKSANDYMSAKALMLQDYPRVKATRTGQILEIINLFFLTSTTPKGRLKSGPNLRRQRWRLDRGSPFQFAVCWRRLTRFGGALGLSGQSRHGQGDRISHWKRSTWTNLQDSKQTNVQFRRATLTLNTSEKKMKSLVKFPWLNTG